MINVGRLTEEQTQELLRECIYVLPWETLAGTLNDALNKEQKEELGEQWFNIDR